MEFLDTRPISAWEFSETAVCPRCKALTHPEYLRADPAGFVIGCSTCRPKKSYGWTHS